MFVRAFLSKKQAEKINRSMLPKILPKVLILYGTKNDFCANKLLKSMQQTYSNFETFILDDSSEE
jgi:hypothetical protein